MSCIGCRGRFESRSRVIARDQVEFDLHFASGLLYFANKAAGQLRGLIAGGDPGDCGWWCRRCRCRCRRYRWQGPHRGNQCVALCGDGAVPGPSRRQPPTRRRPAAENGECVDEDRAEAGVDCGGIVGVHWISDFPALETCSNGGRSSRSKISSAASVPRPAPAWKGPNRAEGARGRAWSRPRGHAQERRVVHWHDAEVGAPSRRPCAFQLFLKLLLVEWLLTDIEVNRGAVVANHGGHAGHQRRKGPSAWGAFYARTSR